jgi:hypothetical protein
MQSDVRSGWDARFAEENLPRDRAAAQPAVIKEPRVALVAGIALDRGGLVERFARDVGRSACTCAADQATE